MAMALPTSNGSGQRTLAQFGHTAHCKEDPEALGLAVSSKAESMATLHASRFTLHASRFTLH